MIVCLCHGISDKTIKALIESGKKIEEITASCGAGLSCGACLKLIQSEIDVYKKKKGR